MRNFRELKVWQNGMQIALDCYKLCADFPVSERFGMTAQMTRAAVSIVSNIAEGCSRTSQRELVHFLEISLGSCFELETQLLLAKSLQYSNPALLDGILEKLTVIEKMLSIFRIRIKDAEKVKRASE